MVQTSLTQEPASAPRGGATAGRQHEGELTPEQQGDIEKNKDVAAMSYLWILSVVVLYARRDSPFIRYHAKQGVWLFVISIPLWLLPRVGHLLEFLVLAGMIIGFLNAAQGRYHDVPVIGRLAKGTLTLRDIWKAFVRGVSKGADTVKRGVTPAGKSASKGASSVQKQSPRSEPPTSP